LVCNSSDVRVVCVLAWNDISFPVAHVVSNLDAPMSCVG